MSKFFLRARWRPARCAFPVFLFTTALRHEALALVEPHLDADLPVRRVGFREAVVDVRAQRLQRQLAVEIPLGSRDFAAVEAARHAHLDAAGAEAQRRLDGLPHRAAEGDTLLELHRNRFGNELAV